MEQINVWLVPVLICGGAGVALTILIKLFPKEKIFNAGRIVSRFLGAKIGKGNVEKIEKEIIEPFVQGMESDNEEKK